jgi:hypothetical protein
MVVVGFVVACLAGESCAARVSSKTIILSLEFTFAAPVHFFTAFPQLNPRGFSV